MGGEVAVFNKQENLLMRLVLSPHKMGRSPYLPSRILNVPIETLTGFSHVFSPNALSNPLLSQVCLFGTNFPCVNGKQSIHSKNRRSEKPPIAWVQLVGQPEEVMSSRRRHPTETKTESLSNLLEFTQLASGGSRIQT